MHSLLNLPALLSPSNLHFSLSLQKKKKNLPKKEKNLTWQKRSFIKYDVTSVPDHLSPPLLSEEVCSLRSSAVPNVCTQQITTCRAAVMFNNDLIMRTHTQMHTLECGSLDSVAVQTARLGDQRLLRPVLFPRG